MFMLLGHLLLVSYLYLAHFTDTSLRHSLHLGVSLSLGIPSLLGINPKYFHTFDLLFSLTTSHPVAVYDSVSSLCLLLSVSKHFTISASKTHGDAIVVENYLYG